MGFFEKLGIGLKKTKDGIFDSITKAIISSPVTPEMYDDLFEQLILADVGFETSEYLCEELKKQAIKQRAQDGQDVVRILQGIIIDLLKAENEIDLSGTPSVILVIGVNGVGKTTSIGKLANLYKQQGKKVLLAAGDTFRAAAASQLNEWAQRSGVDILMREEGADPSSVTFEAVQKA
ncbi:MAG: signal recognition particle receptor subunit alpha, partial [Oscillospiraceae bacterium]